MRSVGRTGERGLGSDVGTGGRGGVGTERAEHSAGTSGVTDEATEIGQRFREKVGGGPMNLVTETLMGIPSTAHILGGACMGEDAGSGVIDPLHRVHGHPGLYVIDGSAVSANPRVNPSLTITALAERAMSHVAAAPPRS